jgi:enoyl-CoA hydratase
MSVVELVMEGPAKNALGTALLTRVRDTLREAGDAPVLLTGAGDAFSAGLNLKELASLDAAGMRAFLELLLETTERLFRHPGPVVAAVNGHAVAGGAILAAACDHRVGTTSPKARIGLNEVALGLRFPPGLLEVVRYRVAHVEPVVLGAELLDPQTALRWGLLDELADDPVAAARARLEVLAAHPRAAYTAAKHDLRRRVSITDPELSRRFVEEALPRWTDDAFRERIAAFLSRR